jgi:hypothetical protein
MTMHISASRSLPLAFLVLAACSNDFTPGARVTKLRLLAVQAEPPFARPGERVQLRLLVADPESRPLQWALGTCTNPPASTAGACLSALDGPLSPVFPDADALDVQVPQNTLDGLSADARGGAALGAVLVACPGELADGDTDAVPIRCQREQQPLDLADFEVGVKRILIREQERNQNPELTAVRWDGAQWPPEFVPEVSACDAAKDDLEDCPSELRHRIDVDSSDPESGQDQGGTAFTEQQIVQYYASEGVFEYEVRVADEADNRWAAQGDGGERVATLWFVVRDNRGGVSWTTRNVQVR